jgi:hypothetical protein
MKRSEIREGRSAGQPGFRKLHPSYIGCTVTREQYRRALVVDKGLPTTNARIDSPEPKAPTTSAQPLLPYQRHQSALAA